MNKVGFRAYRGTLPVAVMEACFDDRGDRQAFLLKVRSRGE